MTPQEIDRIECAIRHIKSSLDVDPWAMEIAVEAMKTQLSAEGTTSDLISRQAAIALANSLKDDLPDDERMVDAVMAHNEGIMEYQTKLSLLPSAHSEIEERTEEFAQNVPKEDLISRKAAIEAMSESLKRVFPEHRQIAEKCLKALPSAQPERETAKFIRWMECKKTVNYISYTPHCKCSKCGTEFIIETIKYCYMCGARMER